MDDLRIECHRRLMAWSWKVIRESRKHLSQLGFAWNQYTVMKNINPGEAITLSELSARTFKENSNITSIVDFLESKDIVRRINDPADRRIVRVELTQEGVKIRGEVMSQHEAFIQGLYPPISESDTLALIRILDILNKQSSGEKE